MGPWGKVPFVMLVIPTHMFGGGEVSIDSFGSLNVCNQFPSFCSKCCTEAQKRSNIFIQPWFLVGWRVTLQLYAGITTTVTLQLIEMLVCVCGVDFISPIKPIVTIEPCGAKL